MRTGTVTAFDDDRGTGTVESDEGESWLFHCTAIVDGTRRVEVGRRVAFEVAAGHLGHMEARALTALA